MDPMYLVHARLRAPDGAELSAERVPLFMCCGRDGEGLEHVSVHSDAVGGPVVGLYLTAPSLAVAEHSALAVCRRALSAHTELAGFAVVACGAVLVPQYWDRLALPDGSGRITPLRDPPRPDPPHPF
ncbi:hypothetical protein OG897_33540 [Streptomyces sp. NBC_00237]|uniref:hypothetical protein n=1 Tax=Streptomyces sp. NBC_00237 TaxID=2975687 RepID=UPI002255F62C|nr:hypothetical protein [Streptomyces sp. NBC_00237]MCX5206317.1 hypothetical protein [Streptomyces sp. NBC_00237]